MPFHWQTFLPELLAPDGVLSALRLVLGPALETESGGGDASARAGPAGARLDAVAALQNDVSPLWSKGHLDCICNSINSSKQ